MTDERLKPVSQMNRRELAAEAEQRGGVKPEYMNVPALRAWLRRRRQRDASR